MGLFSSPLQWPLSDEACTSGQLVVASRESQYKVFHFHHGGLDKLPDVLQQWKYCTETHLKDQVAREGEWVLPPLPFPSPPFPSPPFPSLPASLPTQTRTPTLSLGVPGLKGVTCGRWGQTEQQLWV